VVLLQNLDLLAPVWHPANIAQYTSHTQAALPCLSCFVLIIVVVVVVVVVFVVFVVLRGEIRFALYGMKKKTGKQLGRSGYWDS